MENKKQQQSARRRQEDAALRKLLIWFGAAVVYEAVILFLRRFYINFHTGWETEVAFGVMRVLQVLCVAAPIGTVAAAAWLVWSRKQDRPLIPPLVCTGVLAGLSATALAVYRFTGLGVDVLSVIPPVAAVLALVYYLYQREFFCNTVLAAGGILALWLYRRIFQVHPLWIWAGFVVLWLVLAGAAWAAWRLSQSGGEWKGVHFSPKTVYTPTYVTCALTAVTLAAAMIGGASAAYYAIFALVIWLFCMAVYYTVRLM